MNEHGLTEENLLATLPVPLQRDPVMTALAKVTAGLLADRLKELDRLRIYPAIDRLEEPLLDLLAHDFKVDWWNGDYTLEEKRRTLAGSWQVHKTLGTKAAVVKAVSAAYPNTQVLEWFQYGGSPHHFKLLLESHPSPEEKRRLLAAVEQIKRKSQWLDKLVYRCIATVRQEERFLPVALCIRSGVWNLRGVPPVRWNGSRLFDGSIAFDQMPPAGARTLALWVRAGIREGPRVWGGVTVRGVTRSRERAGVSPALRVRAAAPESLRPRQLVIQSGAGCRNSSSITLRRDTLYSFGESYTFDGTRRFNANITEETL